MNWTVSSAVLAPPFKLEMAAILGLEASVRPVLGQVAAGQWEKVIMTYQCAAVALLDASEGRAEEANAVEEALAQVDGLLHELDLTHLAWPPLAHGPEPTGGKLYLAALVGLTVLLEALISHRIWQALSCRRQKEIERAVAKAANAFIGVVQGGDAPDLQYLAATFDAVDRVLLTVGCRPAFAPAEARRRPS
jgi:hypothetical protein